MRIAQVANFFGPTSGGLRTTLEALASAYAAGGHEVLQVVPTARDEHVVLGPGLRRIGVRAPQPPGLGGYRIVMSPARVAEVLERERPDRLEVSDRFTLSGLGTWARQRGVPVVLFAHERLDAILAPRVPAVLPLGRLADSWNRRTARRFDAVVCASAFAAQEWARIGVTHVHTIPLGVDLETFRPRPRAVRSFHSATRLVCVSRLSAEKRPELAVDVLAVLRAMGVDAELVLIGAGPMESALRARAAALPVQFTGHVRDRALLARMIGDADVAVAPCPHEAFGLSVLEAMACGTPVVVADGGAAPELLGPGAGAAAPPDGPSLAAAVCDVLGVPAAARRQAARSRAEEFPWSRTAEAMLRVHGGAGPAPGWVGEREAG